MNTLTSGTRNAVMHMPGPDNSSVTAEGDKCGKQTCRLIKCQTINISWPYFVCKYISYDQTHSNAVPKAGKYVAQAQRAPLHGQDIVLSHA